MQAGYLLTALPKPISTVTLRQLSVKDSMKTKYLLLIQVLDINNFMQIKNIGICFLLNFLCCHV